jgi:riboflavin kinase/FMN adenylyltransferase
MALGFFDGVHLGHQEVIKTAKAAADKRNLPLAAMSFFPHPKEVLSKGKKEFSYLMPLDEKQKKLEQLGVEIFYLVHFDKEFAALSPNQFVKNYLLDFEAKLVVAGFDFTYGRNGEGHMDRMVGDSNGILNVIKVGKIDFKGEKISSTMIRNLVCSGKVDEIPNFLGEVYQIEGTLAYKQKHVHIKASPYYLLPSSGIYEVGLVNGSEYWKQEVIVRNDQITFMLPERGLVPFIHSETIRIHWLTRLPSQSQQPFNPSKYLENLVFS